MSTTSSPFGQNEWLVEEMYRKFRDDPSSVDPSWHEFLVDYNPEPTAETQTTTDAQPDQRPAPAPAKPAPQPAAGNGAACL
ncbi:2-oxoglutarate dehydrogenase E1 subunit family protein, partial [Mycobacterium talmoniae]|uniref:2-oxoglutarate dehydrogenase E1 subunit family protein n=1 Tax=Mycobacterium talmoniae TaxID=1858794 RepID=UPI0010588E56